MKEEEDGKRDHLLTNSMPLIIFFVLVFFGDI